MIATLTSTLKDFTYNEYYTYSLKYFEVPFQMQFAILDFFFFHFLTSDKKWAISKPT